MLDSGARGLTGSLDVLIDGVPGTIQVDGVSDTFAGSALQPTRLTIDDATGAGTLSLVHLELAPVELVLPDAAPFDFHVGQTTTLLFRGRGGDLYGYGASFSSLPGINTGIGDIPIVLDDLLLLSLDPGNGIFFDTFGTLPPSGEQAVNIVLPLLVGLDGFNFFLGGATLHPQTSELLGITNSHRATLR
jgi:hypothetical protein